MTSTAPTDILTEVEAGALLGYKPSTLRTWRSANVGPAYLKLGRNTVRYRRADLTAWADAFRQVTLESS